MGVGRIGSGVGVNNRVFIISELISCITLLFSSVRALSCGNCRVMY